MSADRMPTGRGIAQLATVPDRERRDGGPELVIRGEHPVIPVPVLPRRRDQIREPIEELKRREFDDASGSRPRRFSPATPPDPDRNPCCNLLMASQKLCTFKY
jgi:hypothetical protein